MSKMQLTATVLTLASFVLTGLTITNAFYQKNQFYPSVVYLTKSNPSMAVFYVQALVAVLLFGKLIKWVFFGQLRAAETEHLMERGWYAVTETCLAFTVFRDDFSAKFVAQFTLLLFMKCFHWLTEDRVDFMERSPVITLKFHARLMGLIAVLSAVDSYFCSHAYFSTLLRGASSQIVFGFEYAILMTIVFHVSIKYILHTADLRNVHPWENKAVYLLYTELIIDFIRCVLYTVFVAVMIRLHTFPLFSIRPFYLTVRAFKKAVHDVIMSRRAIHAMNHLFPDATAQELEAGDNVCIICREEMHAPVAKRLPCNHTFHAACLRSWFQRQQTCPTCRSDILSMPPIAGVRGAPAAAPPPAPAPAAQGAPPPAGAPPGGVQAHPFHPNMAAMFPFIPPGFLPHLPGHAHPAQPRQETGVTTSGTTPTSTSQPTTSTATHTMNMPPFPIMPPPPFMPLPFPAPPNMAGLSDDEVEVMEGRHRQAVESRIRCLYNIQTLLEAATIQLQQYTSILNALASTPEFSSNPEPSTSQPATSDGEREKEESKENPFETLKESDEPSTSANTRIDETEELRQRRLKRFESQNSN